jgi:hypothetical protein|tara:strand:- start:1166 stop:1522 length:357 start_codon:yes stop_codon:yes gene_type:complete
MKLTKATLKRIIKEELDNLSEEEYRNPRAAPDLLAQDLGSALEALKDSVESASQDLADDGDMIGFDDDQVAEVKAMKQILQGISAAAMARGGERRTGVDPDARRAVSEEAMAMLREIS